jgi:hypothetical protein
MLARSLIPLAVALLLVTGCPKTDQSLVLVGGTTVSAAAIDEAPLSLLPSGALIIGTLDAKALMQSSFGPQVAELASALLPLGPESNFVAARDVSRIYAAAYAMQGADVCAVLQGNFDASAIGQAATARARTPSGTPLVRTQYAGYEIYTVANIGFAVLTRATILSGTETGMRRALDRLRYGSLENALPGWMRDLLEQQRDAAFVMVGDLSQQGVVAAAAAQVPFLGGITLLRLLGNFRPPGMNVVGTVGYRDAAAAAQGAAALGQLQQLAYLASLLASWGFGGQMPPLDVSQQGSDVAFATSLDTGLVSMLLTAAAQLLRPGATPSLWGG